MHTLRKLALRASGGPREAVLAEAARRYERCHPKDSFAYLARRAAFSKEDRRLMEDWLAAVAASHAAADGGDHSDCAASSGRQSKR